MKNRIKKENDILLYSINTSNGMNRKCNFLVTGTLIYINCLLSFCEESIDTDYIYNIFTSLLCLELSLNVYDVINIINSNTKLKKLQDLLKKRNIDINFFKDDVYKKETIKYIDGEYIYKEDINITEDVNKSLLSKRKYKKYKKSKQNK